jgi:hypothetical protein
MFRKAASEKYSNWADAGDINVAIVRSPIGIAETGSVLLSETDLRTNTIGFLAKEFLLSCARVHRRLASIGRSDHIRRVIEALS